MFRHMAILRFKPDAKPADIAAYFEAFPNLMASQPTIKSWQIGRNEGAGGETHVRKGSFAPNYDVGLTMVFDNPQGYLTYAESRDTRNSSPNTARRSSLSAWSFSSTRISAATFAQDSY
jgi:hypothetical protein